MARLLAPTSNLLAVILLAMNVPALAVDRTFQTEVENSLKGTVPSNWWLRASWRDQSRAAGGAPLRSCSARCHTARMRLRLAQGPKWAGRRGSL
jgi:hypothetical protein